MNDPREDLSRLARRVDLLERQNRALRRAGILGGLVLSAALGLTGLKAQDRGGGEVEVEVGEAEIEAGGPATNMSANELTARSVRTRTLRARVLNVGRIRAKEIEVEDGILVHKKNGRPAIYMDARSTPSLTITDSGGRPSLRLTAEGGRGRVYMSEAELNAPEPAKAP